MSNRYKGAVISATPPTVNLGEASGIWTPSQQAVYQAAGTWPVVTFPVSRSLRFNSADSAYLSRTPASAGNRKTWTWSGWVKRSFPDGVTDSTNRTLFSAGDSNPWFQLDFIFFGGVGNIEVSFTAGTSAGSNSSAIFRDFSAWYHVVLAVDTTQATDSNRIKLYVNGIQQTFSSTNYPSQNFDTQVNNNIAHYIGRANAASYLNGYMTEVHFIDGQALTPSSFGATNATTGVWGPIGYDGTYGTNGFYLPFVDNSGVTATTLGRDYSANGNNWTPNNFSVTAGAGNDSLVDTPSQYGTDTGAGGEVRGNYATLNPLDKNTSMVVVNGNLDVTKSGTGYGVVRNTIGVSSGKWYWEATVVGVTNSIGNAGRANLGIQTSAGNLNNFIGSDSFGWMYNFDGQSQPGSASYGAAYVTNDVIGVALDMDAGTLVFYKNGVSQGTAFSSLSGTMFPAFSADSTGNTSGWVTNFGQRPFAYTAPSGFKALVTTNLPEPTVVQGDDYFNTVLYTGTGASLGVTGVGFQPDFTWIKTRSGAVGHIQVDAIRGATKYLQSNNTNAEGTDSNVVASFGSDGFTVGSDATTGGSGSTYVAWNWKAGVSNVINEDGTITSTVRANPTAGFSIVSYTGTGSLATVGHGLGVAPSMIIVKNRSTTTFWAVYHASLGNTQGIELNSTNAASTQTAYWNSTSPTSSLFTVNTDNRVNGSSNNMIAYVFAAIPGFSAFGSYTGNGSTDGPFVFTGFRPAFVMVKRTNGAVGWGIYDTARNTFNAFDKTLVANVSDAEQTTVIGDILSNGFKFRYSGSQNTSGATYIYMAFAENPFKYSLAR